MYLKKVNKIFIVHYSKLAERKNYLEKTVNNLNIDNDIMWINFFDRENINEEIINKYFKNTRKLNKAQITTSIAHRYIYEYIEEYNIQNSLILEDDVVFFDDFVNLFNKYFKFFPKDYDIIHIGKYADSCKSKRKPYKNKYFIKANKNKAVGSYLVSLSGAKKINKHKLENVIDHDLNKDNLNIYWLKQPITQQGSKIGKFKCSIK